MATSLGTQTGRKLDQNPGPEWHGSHSAGLRTSGAPASWEVHGDPEQNLIVHLDSRN